MQVQHLVDMAPDQDTRPVQDQFDDLLLEQFLSEDLVRLTKISHLFI